MDKAQEEIESEIKTEKKKIRRENKVRGFIRKLEKKPEAYVYLPPGRKPFYSEHGVEESAEKKLDYHIKYHNERLKLLKAERRALRAKKLQAMRARLMRMPKPKPKKVAYSQQEFIQMRKRKIR